MIDSYFVVKVSTGLSLLILATHLGCSGNEGAKFVVVSDVTLRGGRVDPPIDAWAVHATIKSEKPLKMRGQVETWTAANRLVALSSSSSDSHMEFVSLTRSGVTQIVVSGSLDCRDGCVLDAGVEKKYSLLKNEGVKFKPHESVVVCVSAYTNKLIGSKDSMISSFAMSVFNGTSGDSLPEELSDITFVIYSVMID